MVKVSASANTVLCVWNIDLIIGSRRCDHQQVMLHPHWYRHHVKKFTNGNWWKEQKKWRTLPPYSDNPKRHSFSLSLLRQDVEHITRTIVVWKQTKKREHNLPLWQINFKLCGNTATTSSSILPVMSQLSNVRYATSTPSKVPDLHSSMNSCRFVAWGSRTSARAVISDHVSWALWSNYQYRHVGTKSGILTTAENVGVEGRTVLFDFAQEEHLRPCHQFLVLSV